MSSIRPHVPLPPFDLIRRVGSPNPEADGGDAYVSSAATLRRVLFEALQPMIDPRTARLLDLGCGAGRLLRACVEDVGPGQWVGVDLHPPSIEWANANLSPPFEFLVGAEEPPLPFADGSFDVVVCFSVFTHIDRWWAEWLLELRRVLRTGGFAVISFLTAEQWQSPFAVPTSEDVGMVVNLAGNPWDEGGPVVVHGPWWVERHWGRAFDIVTLLPDPTTGGLPTFGQGLAVLRRPDSPAPSADALRAADPGDPRELRALQHAARVLAAELGAVRRELLTVQRAARDALQAAAASGGAGAEVNGDVVRRLEDLEAFRAAAERRLGMRPAARPS